MTRRIDIPYSEVLAMRADFLPYAFTARMVAEKYGRSINTVNDILYKRTRIFG